MKTVALRSLGCKVNAYETEGMQQILQQNGFLVVPFDKVADIYIVNTCSVTNIADQKSRQMLHRAKKLNPNAVVVAAGCYVQTGYEKLLKDAAVDIIVGNNEKRNIVEIINEYFAASDNDTTKDSENDSKHINSINSTKHIPDMSKPQEYEEMKVTELSEHTRGFIKIEDGCNRFCTYCVIPYARGRVRSRLIKDVVEEVSALVSKGCKEVVLTGINISSYGADRDKKDGSELLELIGELNKIEGLKRIRLGSVDPWIITEDFANRLHDNEKLCPHFHLSMQSGSDSVLARMNRHYTAQEYYERVQILRKVFDNPAITTDVIVGFPGETEEEFEETYAFVEKVNFYEMHVFKYSRRDGTKAAEMPNQVPEPKKTERSDKLISLGEKMSMNYRKNSIGRSTAVLFEEQKIINNKTYWVGYTPEYISMSVEADKEERNLENCFVEGTIGDFVTDTVMELV